MVAAAKKLTPEVVNREEYPTGILRPRVSTHPTLSGPPSSRVHKCVVELTAAYERGNDECGSGDVGAVVITNVL